jgi:hypothetical protein
MRNRLVGLMLLFFLSLSGCSPKDAAPKMERPKGSLAVAGFTNPRFNWELLAGYLPEEGQRVKRENMDKLDILVFSILQEHGVTEFVSPRITRQCQEIVVFATVETTREAAFKYWLRVGECSKADYLLLPQVLAYQDRTGGEWGSQTPAAAVFDLFLIDVKNKSIAGRYHFEEEQQALTDNILSMDKFIQRGGKWLSGEELVREGLEEGLRELGL